MFPVEPRKEENRYPQEEERDECSQVSSEGLVVRERKVPRREGEMERKSEYRKITDEEEDVFAARDENHTG